MGPILAQADCDFVAPVHWPADVLIGARVDEVGRTSFRMAYAAFCDDAVVATGGAVLVLIDYATGAKVAVPDDLRRALLEPGR